MSEFSKAFRSNHTPDDIWKALITPIPDSLAKKIMPSVLVIYEGLDDDDKLQKGSRVTYEPVLSRGRDATFKVEELLPRERSRTDVLVSTHGQGQVNAHVEESADNTSLLVVEAELVLDGFYSMFEESAIEFGIRQPTLAMLEHIPEIIR